MKTTKLFYFGLVLVVAVSSCKPIYKCGETKPEKMLFVPKIVKTVINERDSLCSTLAVRDKQLADMSDTLAVRDNTIARQDSDFQGLQTRFDNLVNTNLSQAEQYNQSLKQKTAEIDKKSQELFDKEKLLADREASLNEMKKVVARQDSITKRLNQILHDALLGFKSDELSVEVKNGKVYVSMTDKLLFSSGSATVQDKGVEALKVLADVMNKNKDIDILIEGHTDNIPIKTALYKDNWDLSVARATSIVRILTDDYHVDATRLTASGKGEYSPKASNNTPEGRAKNRRTEIILSPKLDEIMTLLSK